MKELNQALHALKRSRGTHYLYFYTNGERYITYSHGKMVDIVTVAQRFGFVLTDNNEGYSKRWRAQVPKILTFERKENPAIINLAAVPVDNDNLLET